MIVQNKDRLRAMPEHKGTWKLWSVGKLIQESRKRHYVLLWTDFDNVLIYEPQQAAKVQCKDQQISWWRNVDGRCTHTITVGTKNQTNYQVMSDMNGKDCTSSRAPEVQWHPLCMRGAGIARDNPFQPNGIWSVNSKTYYYRLTLSHRPSLFHSFMVKVSHRQSQF